MASPASSKVTSRLIQECLQAAKEQSERAYQLWLASAYRDLAQHAAWLAARERILYWKTQLRKQERN
jgi:hypothetical protein